MKTCVQGSGYLNLCLGQSFIHFALLSWIFWFLQLVYHWQEKIGVQIDYSAGLHTALCVFKCLHVSKLYSTIHGRMISQFGPPMPSIPTLRAMVSKFDIHWVVVVTPLSRACPCNESFLSLAAYYWIFSELANTIGIFGWLCAIAMWKSIRSFVAQCFHILKTRVESNDRVSCSWKWVGVEPKGT